MPGSMEVTVPATPASPCTGAPDRVTDVVVIGGGALGAATAWWLARAGRSVVLLEASTTRPMRRAVRGTAWSAHPGWTVASRQPDVQEVAEAWCELERQTGAELLVRRDALDLGTGLDPATAGTWFDPETAGERWPGTVFTGPAVLRAGFQIRADLAVAALTAGAVALGVVARYRSPVTAIEALDDERVDVHTPEGRICARRAVVTSLVPSPSRSVELHFRRATDHLDGPLLALHDPELGLVRAASCAFGHLAVGARSWPRGTLGDLRERVQSWWPGLAVDAPEPVVPEAMTTVPAEVLSTRRGPIVSATSTALGSVDVLTHARELAELTRSAGQTAAGRVRLRS
jgi:glycine/D-amino acid oxidase-like deaminating enzyme